MKLETDDAGDTEERGKAASTATYLTQLLRDKKALASLPPLALLHAEALVDEEIKRVRAHLFQCQFATVDAKQMPEPGGQRVTLFEKVVVPCEQYPDVSGCTTSDHHHDCSSTTSSVVSSARAA